VAACIAGEIAIPCMPSECASMPNPFNNFRHLHPSKIRFNFHSPGGHGVRIDTLRIYGLRYSVKLRFHMIARADLRGAKSFCEQTLRITAWSDALSEFVMGALKPAIPFHLKLLQG